MGYSDDRLVAELCLDRLLDQRIGIHIHIRRCLVQDQDLVHRATLKECLLVESISELSICAFVSRTIARARESN